MIDSLNVPGFQAPTGSNDDFATLLLTVYAFNVAIVVEMVHPPRPVSSRPAEAVIKPGELSSAPAGPHVLV